MLTLKTFKSFLTETSCQITSHRVENLNLD